MLAAPAAAQGLEQALEPYQQLQDARRALARQKSPAQLVGLAQGSPSAWVRARADAALADHFAANRDWARLEDYRSFMGPCARLQHAVLQASAQAARQAVPAALEQAAGNNPLCLSALKLAAAGGLVFDRQVWAQMRQLINRRQSRLARKLLVLLKDDKASWAVLNRAIQNATARIKGKLPLAKRVDQELLAVSAVVAIRSNPALVGERWQAFAPHLDRDIAEQVWPLVGLWLSQNHKSRQALQYYQRAARGAHRPVELEWRIRAALRVGDWTEVRDTIAALAPEQAGLSAWRYWSAHAQQQLGNAALGRRLMREVAADFDDYYGLLAGEQVGVRLQKESAPPPAGAIERMARDADIRLAIALGLDSRVGAARSVWKFMFPRLNAAEILAAAYLASEHGWLLGSINAAEKAAPQLSNHALRFPMPYAKTIDAYIRRFDLDPAFVYALIRRESRFNPQAVSSAGARGIMQVMPSTASSVSRRHKYTRYNLRRLTRVDTNIIIGTRYLADLVQQIGAEPALVAAAYNAGPGRVRKWLSSSPGLDKTIFIESIPFTETRLYVKAVLAAQAHYGLALGQSGGAWHRALSGSYG